ncbi:unnamed protein product [Rhizoctonia solani]|uniref:F-box domain-containing protein n=1 Tax=Rhizoctonia solani TaxID=456999 RepID=A0A8H2XYA1_9AGAM|nr:unnamed protein product [Rhizoctonia solani]
MPLTRAMTAAQTAGEDKAVTSRSNNNHTSRVDKVADQDTGAEHPPRKRKRKRIAQAPKRTKNSKARLSRLLDMPPEVFNEVAAHLSPADLLSLARSNKFFRKMLMSRTSQYLWKQALANDPEIPECPPELSEPQYVSLLFSKTCSSCGARVLRRMDPYLYVRLCNSCRDEQVVEVSLLNDFSPMLPISDGSDRTVITESPFGFGYTLRSEALKVNTAVKQAMENGDTEWRDRRIDEMDERRARGEELEDYLDMIEDEREMELELLKVQRRDQIRARLLEEGWTEQSTRPSPDNSVEWHKLVWQPKPLTDRIWNNLYPKLIPFLQSNRTYNDELDKKTRRKERVRKVQALVASVRIALPPLAHLVRKTPTTDHESSASTSVSAPIYPEVKVDQAFPSTKELLAWPMIKNMIDDDISTEEVETRFSEIRGEFDRAVVEWRDRIEQDLVTVWNAGREDEIAPESTNKNGGKGKGKGKGKAVVRTTKAGARKTRTSAGAAGTLGSHAAEVVLPEFIATYTKPDGTPTTNISDLSPNLQLLLRADTMFGPTDGFVLNRMYPAIVPRAVPAMTGGPDELNYGDRWNAGRIKRDDDMSAVARKLLVRAGRPDATSLEMKALGINFRCGRCNRTLTDGWEDLVMHYSVEQRRNRQAQEKIRSEPGRGFVYRTTHDLDSENPRPFAHLMTPQAAAEYMIESSLQHSPMMTCIKCQEMGIEARYFHTFAPGFESPIIEHLHNVHGVAVAQPGVHFQGWYGGPHLFDLSESEDDYAVNDYDSEDDWGIYFS